MAMIARPHQAVWSLRLKRVLDVIGAVVVLGLGLLLMALLAFAIWVDSGLPILYRSRRHGRGGRAFTMCKFRTMVRGAEEQLPVVLHLNQAEGNQVKIAQDPRCTPVGRFLRRTSLDELPNVLNVIKGDMSLIGPRPHTFQEYPEMTPALLERLQMRPGMTGLWQVSARNNLAEAVRMRYDHQYLLRWSLWLDLCIALRTVPVVLRCNGGEPDCFDSAAGADAGPTATDEANLMQAGNDV